MSSSCVEVPLIAKIEPPPPPSPGLSTTIINHPNKKWSSSMRTNCCVSSARELWDRLFDEAYRADVKIHTDCDTIICAHASILGSISPVFRSMFTKSRNKHRISIHGVPPEAVRTFIRFLYTSCYEEAEMEEHVLSLLVLSHAFAVPQLKRECEYQLESRLLNMENVVDAFQLAVLCDAPRLSVICHRFVLNSFKAASSSTGWKAMKDSHPKLEKELLKSIMNENLKRKESIRKMKERKVYLQLYEAMETLVHICRDSCSTNGQDLKEADQEACKRLESLVRHFAGCKLRVPGGCHHCKRTWQLLELHARLCADSELCQVPLCSDFKQRIEKEKNEKKRKKDVMKKKKDDMKWKILVRKILRTKSITGAPYFTLESSL